MVYPRISDRVSIVVTNYNNGHYIRACLNSILRQTYKNLELIIVDDSSTDRSIHKIRAWKHSLKLPRQTKNRIVIVSLPRNIGFAGAVHTGLFMSRGEFIAMQDADDLSHLERIKKQVQFLRERTDIDVVGSNYSAFETGNFYQQEHPHWLRYGEEIKQTYQKGGHCVCHGSMLFRSSVFDRVGGHTRKMEGAEDYEFVSQCINHGIGVENIPEILYYYRSHSAQRSRKYYQ